MFELLKCTIYPSISLKFLFMQSSFIEPFIIRRNNNTVSSSFSYDLHSILKIGHFGVFEEKRSFKRITVFPLTNEFELVCEIESSIEKSLELRTIKSSIIFGPIGVTQCALNYLAIFVRSLIIRSICEYQFSFTFSNIKLPLP